MTRLPDESTILRFRHFLEAHRIHSVSTTAAHAHDVTQAAALLHGQRRLCRLGLSGREQAPGDVAGMSASAVCQNGRQRPAAKPGRNRPENPDLGPKDFMMWSSGGRGFGGGGFADVP